MSEADKAMYEHVVFESATRLHIEIATRSSVVRNPWGQVRSSARPRPAALVKQLERRKEWIFPQVDRSRTLRSEPFSSRLVTDQRSNNCA
jgi:hypothetical protein